MALLGDDGRGYELARKLESHGVWRSWLGDSLYSSFVYFLSSSSSWEAFMRADVSKTLSQIHLQLRVRALLYDKAAVSLASLPSAASVQKLNPNYLQLHGDDVYFTLEQTQDGLQQGLGISPSKPKLSLGAGSRDSRNGESEIEVMSQHFKLEELPDTWYTQFFEKYIGKTYKISFGEREPEKRTPEQMSNYSGALETHKRRRVAIKEQGSNTHSCSVLDDNVSLQHDKLFLPETMFTLNSVPDSAVLERRDVKDNMKVELNGILDTLPWVRTKSPIMIERLGIKVEYLSTEQGGRQTRGEIGSEGSKKSLSEEQALIMSQKMIARLLRNVGFESSSEIPLQILGQFLSCHVCKLGRVLRLLADSYRKQCTAFELLKMFLHTSGQSNIGSLSEIVKDSTSNIVLQTQKQVHGIQSQMQMQPQQLSMQQSQPIPRQIQTQMQHMINPQLALQQQQQWERMRRLKMQQSSTRPAIGASMNVNMNMDKDRPLVEVKTEKDLPMDNNGFSTMNSRYPQLQQLRQQQLAMSALHAQAGNQFRPSTSLPISQIQSPNIGVIRAPPVKVEGFQELMGGDTPLKSDSEER